MRIFFSAGEPSGDQHAAHLISELRSRDAGIRAEGFGGPEMQKEGCELLFELTQLAVMGFLRVVPMLAKFRRLVIKAEEFFDESPPDAVVLVDFPGFNWWIARAAKKRGIPVIYYMPPQLWAWAPWRIRRVRKWVDHVICSLPFEYDWYCRKGVTATWVGHPFFDEVAAKALDHSLVDQLSDAQERGPLVGMLPGSRDHEVTRNFPLMLQTVDRVAASVPLARWVVGCYRPEHVETCRQLQTEADVKADITYFVDRTSEVIAAANCCLMVSGSVSLELLARNTPAVVVYKVPRIGKLAAAVLMRCKYVTLVNLIAKKMLMPEFVSAWRPERDISEMTQHLVNWLSSEDVLAERTAELQELAKTACTLGATKRAADVVLAELTEHLSPRTSKAA